jgi:hypothetical protein
MPDVLPSLDQILAEWAISEPAVDVAQWQEGMSRYESGPADGADPGQAAELMCHGLTHYVAGASILPAAAGQPADAMAARTIWNVLVTTLREARAAGLGAESARCLRLALAATRQGGFQPADLGGNDAMAQVFDSLSRSLMSAALSGLPGRAHVPPVNLVSWFAAGSGPAATESTPRSARWDAVKERARQVQQHANPLALQHGIESVQGALTGANIAKVDKKTGKVKVRKLGVAKAALRPAKTVRDAIDGASVSEHLRAYNESSAARVGGAASGTGAAAGPATGSGTGSAATGSTGTGSTATATTAAEFASYGLKRDYLRDWARRLVLAAGGAPTEQLIAEHAGMAADAISIMVFLRLGSRHGITDLAQYFPGGQLPPGPSLDTFDALYRRVIEVEGESRAADEKIAAFLSGCWDDWASGIRDRLSPRDSSGKRS